VGIAEETGKAVASVTDSLKGTPIVLSLMILVFGSMGFAAYLLGLGVTSSRDRDKAQMELISKLVTDIRDCRQGK
jgi:hypothetical protein